MTKQYSIKRRVLHCVSEIVIGTVLNIFVLFLLSYVLAMTGQLNSYGSDFKVDIKDSLALLRRLLSG